MATDSVDVEERLAPFEAWAANVDPPDDLKEKAQLGRSICFAVIGKEEDPFKLYEIAVIHYGYSEEINREHFVEVTAKAAAGSPGDSKQVVFKVHASLITPNSPYSCSVLNNPSKVSEFNPLRVWLAPPEVFNKLDRVFLSKIEPVPKGWATHSEQIASKALPSPPSRNYLKQANNVGKKASKARKRRRGPSGTSSSSEPTSSDEERERSLTRAEQAAGSHKVKNR
jgi:hypothetical protein